jgi:hypothetical protein
MIGEPMARKASTARSVSLTLRRIGNTSPNAIESQQKARQWTKAHFSEFVNRVATFTRTRARERVTGKRHGRH